MHPEKFLRIGPDFVCAILPHPDSFVTSALQKLFSYLFTYFPNFSTFKELFRRGLNGVERGRFTKTHLFQQAYNLREPRVFRAYLTELYTYLWKRLGYRYISMSIPPIKNTEDTELLFAV